MAREFDVIVAGGGIAGLTAGMESARLGRTTLVLVGDMLGGHLLSIEKIEAYPGFPDGVPGYDLCPMAQGQAAEAGAEFAMAALESLAPADGVWRLSAGGEDYAARAVILATGTSLKELGVPGEEAYRGKGVSHCASCDAPLLRGQPVAVVGGGDSALQEALTLAEAVSNVTVLHRGEHLTAQETFRARAEAHPRISFRFGTEVHEILGDQSVTGLRLQNGAGAPETLEVAGVFIYIGLSPNTAFLEGVLERDPSGAVPSDMAMRTTAPGLFTAGTVRAGAIGRAVAAAGDGTMAAIAADRYLGAVI